MNDSANTPIKLIELALLLILSYLCLSPFLSIMTLMGDGVNQYILKPFFGILLIICLACAMNNYREIIKNRILIILILMVVYGLSAGVIQNGIAQVLAGSQIYIAASTTIIVIAFVKNEISDKYLRKTFELWTNLFSIACILGGVLFIIMRINEGIYAGFSSGGILIAVVVCLTLGKNKLLLFLLAVSIISAKRGQLLGLTVVIIVDFLFPYFDKFWKLTASLLSVILLVIPVVFVSAHIVVKCEVPLLYDIAKKIDSLNPISNDIKLKRATGYRSAEIKSAISHMERAYKAGWLTGMGYGFKFKWETAIKEKTAGYTHNTLVNYVLQYGVIITAVFGFIMCFLIMRLFYYSKEEKDFSPIFVSCILLAF